MRYFAFLRAINVGGHIVKMERLRELFESFGFAKVETFIASGNVVFESDEKNTQKLESQIETGLQAALGYEVITFVRTPSELAGIAAHETFPREQVETAHALYVVFLRDGLTAEATQKLMALQTDVDSFHVHGRELYWLCRVPSHESKISNVALEKALKVRATMRNINTPQKMAAKWAREK